MDPRLRILAASDGAFSVGAARKHAVRRAEWDAPALLRPFRGARLVPDDADPRELGMYAAERRVALRRIVTLSKVLPEGAFIAGASAALLWGLPVPRAELALVHTGVLFPGTPTRRPGVVGRRFSPGLVTPTVLRGVRVLDVASTWASLGARCGVDDLVAAADAAILQPRSHGGFHPEALRPAHVSAGQLGEALERGRWLGVRKLRAALGLAREGSASPPETFLRLRLGEAGLPEPRLNFDIEDHGAWIACGDVVFPEYRVCVEYQGAHHRTSAQYSLDLDRAQRLRSLGWIVVELAAAHVLVSPQVGVGRVEAALRSRGWRDERWR